VSNPYGGPARQPRLSRQEAKARTRSLLLEAAAAVFAQKGYAGASVDDIAEHAGFTTGALYSNFAGKEELFIELLSARKSGRMANATRVVADEEIPIEQRRAMLARQLVDIADEEAGSAVLEAEFWLYAMRRPDFQQRLAAQFRDNRDELATVLSNWARGQSRPDDIPFDEVATVLLALFQGLIHLRRTDPALVPDDLYASATRWLFQGITNIYPPAE
jgi:AcrR family transcriptional regulator